ncbi:MAG: helix-turn-helix transcriptional regulator [Pseudomonadota bacterium]
MDINLIPSVLSSLQDDGLTQSEIGEAIGCSQSTISDMMTGKSGLTRPSYKIISGLEALAKQHGVSTELAPEGRGLPHQPVG